MTPVPKKPIPSARRLSRRAVRFDVRPPILLEGPPALCLCFHFKFPMALLTSHFRRPVHSARPIWSTAACRRFPKPRLAQAVLLLPPLVDRGVGICLAPIGLRQGTASAVPQLAQDRTALAAEGTFASLPLFSFQILFKFEIAFRLWLATNYFRR